MSHPKQQISIWFFIGVLLLIYGVLILGASLSGSESPEVARLDYHAGTWWGALLIVIGGFYTFSFRPSRR